MPEPTNEQQSLSQRVTSTKIAMLDFKEREKNAVGHERSANLLRRTKIVVDAIREQTAIQGQINDHRVQAKQLAKNDAEAVSKAKKALRTTITKLTEPTNDFQNVISAPSLDGAIKTAESVAEKRSSSIQAQFKEFRINCKPKNLGDVTTNGMTNVKLAAKVDRLKLSLAAERIVTLNEISESYKKFVKDLDEWESIQEEVTAAVQHQPKELIDFFRRVDGGFPWSKLSDNIREWLDEKGNGDDYVIINRKRLN